MTSMTVAEALIAAFKRRGVQRMFGVPGGGSSLDLIDAAAEQDIDFVLARREDAAVMMAAATAELSGAPGVALTTKGPGTANAVNGVAYASLDRAPLILLTDGFNPAQQGYVTHQVFDQHAMLQPVAKAHSRLDGADAADEIDRLLAVATTPPLGPVHIELTAVAARAACEVASPTTVQPSAPKPFDSTAARELLAGARRPVVVAGLEARDLAGTQAVAALIAELGCPALVTYKAKGVIPDDHPQFAGVFTGGQAERACVDRADLILLLGADPVEFILKPWPYDKAIVEVGLAPHPVHYVTPTAGIYGPLHAGIAALRGGNSGSDWTAEEIADLRAGMTAGLAYPGAGPLNPQSVVEIAQAELTGDPRVTVDAGAHMISAMAFWQAQRANDMLISNGLATMGFALPAAIAGALEDPVRGALAFTGDGGFMMCAGELATAAQHDANITVVVFNDGALSLIDIKQQSRGLSPRGVRWPRSDFARVAEGFGCRAWRVDTVDAYRDALGQANETPGPALIDVHIDPAGYREQLAALRG